MDWKFVYRENDAMTRKGAREIFVFGDRKKPWKAMAQTGMYKQLTRYPPPTSRAVCTNTTYYHKVK
jgi:hypothetical protein